jgi:hypothetical protein
VSTEHRTSAPDPGLSPTTPDQAPQYEIRVAGRLASRWSAWFDGLSVAPETDGTTVLRGPVVDQAALHGVLQKLRDVGIPLVSLRQIPSTHPTPTIEPPARDHQEGN